MHAKSRKIRLNPTDYCAPGKRRGRVGNANGILGRSEVNRSIGIGKGARRFGLSTRLFDGVLSAVTSSLSDLRRRFSRRI